MNKFCKRVLWLLLPLIVLYIHVPAQSVSEFEICADVVDREPQDIKNAFKVGESAWAWMRLTEGTVGDSITVEWYVEEELIHSHKLAVKYESMRTYANKRLTKPGRWAVIVKDPIGETIKEGSFTVRDDESR